MHPSASREDPMEEVERRIVWVLGHPHVSPWLKDALRAAVLGDPVAVANDAEMLRDLLRFRMEAIVQASLRRTA